ncbi:MAG: hypothetical protein WB699_02655 [Bacteroidota bacterium]
MPDQQNLSNLQQLWSDVRTHLFTKDFRPVVFTSFGFFVLVMAPNFTGWYGYFCDEFYH